MSLQAKRTEVAAVLKFKNDNEIAGIVVVDESPTGTEPKMTQEEKEAFERNVKALIEALKNYLHG